MIKLQNKEGDTVFEVQDDAGKPKLVECPKCHQSGEGKPGEYPCPKCGRNLLHDEENQEEE